MAWPKGQKRPLPKQPANPYAGVTGLRLNLGCGPNKLDHYLNIDKADFADLSLDLELAKLPFDNNSVIEVLADQVMEHITNLIPLMNELYRVMAPGAKLKISVPHVPYQEAFQDPTHVRFFTDMSWEYWNANSFYWQEVGKTYGIKPFQHVNLSKDGWVLKATLVKA